MYFVFQWSLVCDKKYLVNTAQIIYFAGVMVGAGVFGQLADKLGRKPVVLFCMYGHILIGVGVYFVKSLAGFITLRFFAGFLVQVSKFKSWYTLEMVLGMVWSNLQDLLICHSRLFKTLPEVSLLS